MWQCSIAWHASSHRLPPSSLSLSSSLVGLPRDLQVERIAWYVFFRTSVHQAVFFQTACMTIGVGDKAVVDFCEKHIETVVCPSATSAGPDLALHEILAR